MKTIKLSKEDNGIFSGDEYEFIIGVNGIYYELGSEIKVNVKNGEVEGGDLEFAGTVFRVTGEDEQMKKLIAEKEEKIGSDKLERAKEGAMKAMISSLDMEAELVKLKVEMSTYENKYNIGDTVKIIKWGSFNTDQVGIIIENKMTEGVMYGALKKLGEPAGGIEAFKERWIKLMKVKVLSSGMYPGSGAIGWLMPEEEFVAAKNTFSTTELETWPRAECGRRMPRVLLDTDILSEIIKQSANGDIFPPLIKAYEKGIGYHDHKSSPSDGIIDVKFVKSNNGIAIESYNRELGEDDEQPPSEKLEAKNKDYYTKPMYSRAKIEATLMELNKKI